MRRRRYGCVGERLPSLLSSAPGRREWPNRGIAGLPTLPQIMIGNHACHHSLADRDGANADTGIVTSFGRNFRLVAIAIDGTTRGKDRRSRLDRKTGDHRLAGGYA